MARDRIHIVEDMEGNTQTIMNGIKEAFVKYFASTLANPISHVPNLSQLFNANLPCISDVQAANLISLINPDEIKLTVFSLNPSSSGGLDGYNSFFLHQCWNIIDKDIISTV